MVARDIKRIHIKWLVTVQFCHDIKIQFILIFTVYTHKLYWCRCFAFNHANMEKFCYQYIARKACTSCTAVTLLLSAKHFHPDIPETSNGRFQIQSRASPLYKLGLKRVNRRNSHFSWDANFSPDSQSFNVFILSFWKGNSIKFVR